MGVIYLLDTNLCVRYLRALAAPSLEVQLQQLATDDEVVLCSVVRAELIYGALRSRDAQRNLNEVRRFCAGFRSLPFDDAAAEECGRLRALLGAAGQRIGPNDFMIAAIATANGARVVTHNVREFSRVPGLVVEDWEAGSAGP